MSTTEDTKSQEEQLAEIDSLTNGHYFVGSIEKITHADQPIHSIGVFVADGKPKTIMDITRLDRKGEGHWGNSTDIYEGEAIKAFLGLDDATKLSDVAKVLMQKLHAQDQTPVIESVDSQQE